MPKLSVIIPVYKVEDYLRQCVDSVLQQDFKDLEIILVDDGSPDNCPLLCDEYAEKYDLVHVIHKENGGLSDARNVGLMNAVGKYVIYLDSDDFWSKKASLDTIINLAEKDNSDVLLFNSINYLDGKGFYKRKKDVDFNSLEGLSVKEIYAKFLECGNLHEHACTKVFDRQFLIDNELFYQKGLLGEDTEMMFRLLRRVKKYDAVNEYLYCYRMGREGSITNSIKAKNLYDIFSVINQSLDFYAANPNFDPEIKEYEMSHCAYLWFNALFLLGKVQKSEKKALVKEFKKLDTVTKYARTKKLKLLGKIKRVFGIRFLSFILTLYAKRRKNIDKFEKVDDGE